MKLYTSNFPPNPRKVEALILAKGLDINNISNLDVIRVDLAKGEHLTTEFKRLNPFGLLPVLVLDDGTILNDSQAICEYLDNVLEGEKLLGNNPIQSAKITAMSRNAEFHVMYNMMLAFQHGHPARASLQPQVAGMDADSLRRVRASLPYFDNLLAKSEFLLGDEMTFADIVLYLGLDFGRVMKFKADDGANVGVNVARFYSMMNNKFGVKK